MTSFLPLASATQTGAMPMNKWLYVLLHTAAATAFIFLLQRFVMSATLETSLLWAVGFGACAAILATKQANR
jgi:hypothetical protein